MKLRILASTILIFCVLFLPFWVSLVLCLAGVLYFRLFFESAGIMLLSDLLYGVQEDKLLGVYFVSFLSILVIIFLAEFFKKKLKFYQR